MRTSFVGTFFSCSLLLTGGFARAQQYPPEQYPPPQQGSPYERGPYGEPRSAAPSYGAPAYGGYGYAGGLFERVQADLGRAEAGANRSRGRFDHARHELAEFQDRLSRGRFDRGRLDDAIKAVQKAADTRWIRERDRAALLEDAERMREFRASGGSYGAPPYGPGYRR